MKKIPKLASVVLSLVFCSIVVDAADSEHQCVTVRPPMTGWYIRVTPDGSVTAEYGSQPFRIFMHKGAVDFEAFVKKVKEVGIRRTDREVFNDRTKNAEHFRLTKVVLVTDSEGEYLLSLEKSIDRAWLAVEDTQFLRELLPNNPQTWLAEKFWLLGEPEPKVMKYRNLSKRESEFVSSHPFFQSPRSGRGLP